MPIAAQLLAEFDQEVATTRRVLERVPEAHFTWQPHPTSFSLGVLALHVATVPGTIARMAEVDTFEVPAFVPPEPPSHASLLAALDESAADFRRIVGGFSEAQFGASWAMVREGQEIMRMPRLTLLRFVAMNHVYHHRGQLAMCLRMLEVPVPSIYGPSRDENPFG